MEDDDFDSLVEYASADCRPMTPRQRLYLCEWLHELSEYEIDQMQLNVVTASVLITRILARKALAKERYGDRKIEMNWDDPAYVDSDK